jgi:hypothetical protein
MDAVENKSLPVPEICVSLVSQPIDSSPYTAALSHVINIDMKFAVCDKNGHECDMEYSCTESCFY